MSRAIRKMRRRTPIVIVGSVAGNVTDVTGATHSPGNIDVGPTNTDKNIILLITFSAQVSRVINTITVGGVSLTQKVSILGSGNEPTGAEIWTADISSINGSKAISATFDDVIDSTGVTAVVVTGLISLTPLMSDTDSNDAAGILTVANLAALVGGITVAVGGSSSRDSTATWGSLTEKADLATGSDAVEDHRHTAAWDLGQRAAANETIDISGGGAGLVRSASGAGFR